MRKSLYREDGDVYYVMVGAEVTNTIAEGIIVAFEEGHPVTFVFNEVTVTVHGDSDIKLIYRDWSRALNGYIDKNVGPYPKVELTDEDKANDASIAAENEREQQAYEAEQSALDKDRRDRVASKLVGAPMMEESNPEAWEKTIMANRDPYGDAILAYADRWARLIQIEMLEGKTLEEVAEATSREADTDGITGFMYGAAVSVLSQCWKHGEQLRRWHNLKTQLRSEGEVANEHGYVLSPALLTITSS